MLAPKKNNILNNQKEVAKQAYQYAATMLSFNLAALGVITIGSAIYYSRRSDHSGEQTAGLNATESFLVQTSRFQRLESIVATLQASCGQSQQSAQSSTTDNVRQEGQAVQVGENAQNRNTQVLLNNNS